MKIDEREVHPPVLAHWKQALDDAPRAALRTLASVHPTLQAGFRPGKVPPVQLRARSRRWSTPAPVQSPEKLLVGRRSDMSSPMRCLQPGKTRSLIVEGSQTYGWLGT